MLAETFFRVNIKYACRDLAFREGKAVGVWLERVQPTPFFLPVCFRCAGFAALCLPSKRDVFLSFLQSKPMKFRCEVMRDMIPERLFVARTLAPPMLASRPIRDKPREK